MVNAESPEDASTVMLKEFEKPAVLNTNQRAGYAREYYNTFGGSGRGATINPRVIKTNAGKLNKVDSGRGSIFDAFTSMKNSAKDYATANTASDVISQKDNGGLSGAITKIIQLLEAITGNTASTSSKLDMLENLKKANVFKGGDTTNVITNTNNNKTSAGSKDILTQGSGTKVSRNQRLAEKIAQGI